ncbi:hypothetical protein E3E36_04165 [Thermococcus sp. M36]|uniref:tubulin-like doman-containing protein n=1 Tax=Thermococcus sp. M36 TaxID=1638261 RepID=UPI00143CB4EA|nr:tubulin-like doman-containing protein [Thermococcus sp. M36]NJE05347.1 hypothetical protein [Thermococcus sp. M36]
MLQFPDVVVGIGGAGKNIVFSILETEWLIEQLLKEDRRYTFIVMDTASAEYGTDVAKAEKLKEKIEDMASRLGRPSNIEIDVRNIISNLSIDRPEVLYTTNLIEALHRKRKVKVWWILDPEKGVNNTEGLKKYEAAGFSKGTIRRRGVTKAMFYKALVEGKVDDVFQIPPGSQEVAIIVGLGGGTGSGLFIDIAKRLAEVNFGAQVVLFGILPTLKEGNNEKANAYIALSELEYLRLTQGKVDDQLFTHVVLTTIEPTGFTGAGDAYKAKTEALNEFAETFTHILMNFYDAKSGNFSDILEGGHYGRFILATGGIVRYEVESTMESKKNLEKAINSLNSAISKEKDIRDKDIRPLIKYLQEKRLIDIGRDENKFYSRYIEYLKNQRILQEFYGFLTNPILGIFNYESPRSIIEGIHSRILMDERGFSEKVAGVKTSGEVLELISQLKTTIDSSKPESFRDDIDKAILDIAMRILDNIQLSLDHLRELHKFAFPDPIRARYEAYESEMGQMLRDLVTFDVKPAQIAKLEELKRAVGTDVTKLERQAQELREKQGEIEGEMKAIESQVDAVIDANSKLLVEYYEMVKELPSLRGTLSTSTKKINGVLEELKAKVLSDSVNRNLGPDELAARVNQELDPVLTNLRTIFTRLAQKFPGSSELGSLREVIDYINLVKNALLHYYGYKYYRYRQENRSLSERLRGRDYEAEMDKYLGDYERDLTSMMRYRDFFHYIRIRTTEDGEIGDLEVTMLYDLIATTINKMFSSIQMDVATNIGGKINVDLSEVPLQKLAEESSTPREFLKKAKEAIYLRMLSQKGLDRQMDEVKEQIAAIERDIESLRDFGSILDYVMDAVLTISGRIRKEWREEYENYESSINELKKYLEEKALRRHERGTFIYKVQPSPEALGLILDVATSNLAQVLRNPTLSAISKNEFQKIVNTYRELLSKLMQPAYLGIRRPRVIVQDERAPVEWELKGSMTYVNSSINNIMTEMAQEIKNVTLQVFRRSLHKGKDTLYIPVPVAGPWDIAVTIFLPGIFFENIYGVYDLSESYHDAYYQLKNSGKKRELFHHVYKLEDGWYIERIPMDFEDAIKYAAAELYNNVDVTEEIEKKNYIKQYIIPESEGETE